MLSFHFSRNSKPITDSELESLAPVIRKAILSGTDAEKDLALLLSKMMFRIREGGAARQEAPLTVHELERALNDIPCFHEMGAELIARELMSNIANRRFLSITATPDDFMLIRKPRRGPFPPALKEGHEWACCGTYAPCRGECAVQQAAGATTEAGGS